MPEIKLQAIFDQVDCNNNSEIDFSGNLILIHLNISKLIYFFSFL